MNFKYLTTRQKIITALLFVIFTSLLFTQSTYYFLNLTTDHQQNIYISAVVREHIFLPQPDQLILEKYNSDGQKLWTRYHPLPDDFIPHSTILTADQNNIYQLADNLYTYSSSGQLLWTHQIPKSYETKHFQILEDQVQLWLQKNIDPQLMTLRLDVTGQHSDFAPSPIQPNRLIQTMTTDSKQRVILATNLLLNQYDPQGDLLWTNKIPYIAYNANLETDFNDNIYLTGIKLPPEIRKYSPTGQLLWKKFHSQVKTQLGWRQLVDITQIATNPTAETVQFFGYIKHHPTEPTVFKTSYANLFNLNYTGDGEFKWNQTFPIDTLLASEHGIQIDTAGNTYVGGSSSWRFRNLPALYLRKYDSTGQLLWSRQPFNYLLLSALLYFLSYIFFDIKNGRPGWMLRVSGTLLVGGSLLYCLFCI